MQYTNMAAGRFLRRPNRFIAHVEIAGREEVCHVKNTGRCKELLVPGATVYCEASQSPTRKTTYDLIAVKKGSRLINMDSQAPNKAVGHWLKEGGLGQVTNLRAEVTQGDSRFDFSFMLEGRQCFLEVKGVTLETEGICAFPDAPTARGTKHLQGLAELAAQGYGTYVLFVIQMTDVKYLRPNDETDPAFGQALRKAAAAGVHILAVDCAVTENSMTIQNSVELRL